MSKKTKASIWRNICSDICHVCGRYPDLFREANSFPRAIAKLEENCEVRGTDDVQGKFCERILKV